MPELSLELLLTAVERCSGHAQAHGQRCSIMRQGDMSCTIATLHGAPYLVVLGPNMLRA